MRYNKKKITGQGFWNIYFKKSLKYIRKPNPTRCKNIIYYEQVRFIPGIQGWFDIYQLIDVIDHINKEKDKNYMMWLSQKMQKKLNVSIFIYNKNFQ